MRNVFVDGGAHRGESVRMFREEFPYSNEFDIYCFEPLPSLYGFFDALDVTLVPKAIWVDNETRPFYVGSHTHVGSLRRDKTTFQFIDTIEVECIDFPHWLDALEDVDRLVVKLDLEGAEYAVLAAMPQRLIQRIDMLFVDFHGFKLTDFDMDIHHRTVDRLKMLGRPPCKWDPSQHTTHTHAP